MAPCQNTAAAPGNQPDKPLRKEDDDKNEDRAVEDLLPERIDRDDDGKETDEHRAADRPQPRVHATENHHHQDVDRRGRVELSGGDVAKETKSPSSNPGDRGG